MVFSYSQVTILHAFLSTIWWSHNFIPNFLLHTLFSGICKFIFCDARNLGVFLSKLGIIFSSSDTISVDNVLIGLLGNVPEKIT